MKKVLNNLKKIKYIIIAILLIAIIGVIIALNNSGVITKLGNAIRRNIFALDEENIETISYYTVGAINGDYLTCQIAFENELGIEKITVGGAEIDGKGKTKIGVDRILQEGEELQFNVKIVGKEQEEIHKILATTKNAITVTNIDTLGDGTTKTVELEYPEINEETTIKQYSLDDGETWQEYTVPLEILESDNKTITSRIKYKENQTIRKADERFSLVVSDSLLSATEKAIMKNDRIYRIAVKDEEYTVHTYVEDESLTLESNTTYGNSGDVATASEYAKNMVIVKVNGDLTINSGVTLTAYGTQYGGPKGMLVYATGTLTNNGTISMTARGAKAVGQNVYLWKNQDTTNAEYEFVPATGAAGGAASPGRANAGQTGTNRKTGGGGSGSSYKSVPQSSTIYYSGTGSAGTSYSGGTGGGGSMYYSYYDPYPKSRYVVRQGGSGSINGGAGGNGTYYSSMYSIALTAAGAGNPGGTGSTYLVQSNGTGGLLIIYGDKIVNEGNISANGSNGASVSTNYKHDNYAGGGASGGGSINMLYNTTCTKGTITANGGTGGSSMLVGGNGGSGSISIGNISTGTYVEYIPPISNESTDDIFREGNELSFTWQELGEIAQIIANESSIITSNTKEVTIAYKGTPITIGVGDYTKIDGKKVRILGFNHDELVDKTAYNNEDGTQNTTAGISFEYVDFLTSTKMNYDEINSGGWKSSVMYTTLNTTEYGNLPSDVKGVIKKVTKKYSKYETGEILYDSEDYLWLLSCAEIYGIKAWAPGIEGLQYKYYKNINATFDASNSNNKYLKKESNVTGTSSNGSWWWLRSPSYNYNTLFCIMDPGGYCQKESAYISRGAAPGFSI